MSEQRTQYQIITAAQRLQQEINQAGLGPPDLEAELGQARGEAEALREQLKQERSEAEAQRQCIAELEQKAQGWQQLCAVGWAEARRAQAQREQAYGLAFEMETAADEALQRLAELEGGAPPPVGAEPPPLASPNANLPLRPPSPPEPTTAAPPPAPPAGTVPPPPRPVASQPGVLGTIPKDLAVTNSRGPATVPPAPPPANATPPATASVAPSQPPAVLPQGTPQSQYDYALSLMLKQQDFARAEQALRAFVRQHPQDKLTGNAQYWLGETYYVRQSYQDAAFAFAEGYQRYPKSGKAPDSLLKLGMSLSRMEKLREACTAFSRFLSKYPKANARLKARIDRERRQAKCR